jgi:hypothetical protein
MLLNVLLLSVTVPSGLRKRTVPSGSTLADRGQPTRRMIKTTPNPTRLIPKPPLFVNGKREAAAERPATIP